MISRWPIRKKLTLGIALLILSVAILAFSGLQGLNAFRGLARGISRRATEMPYAISLAQNTSALQATVAYADRLPDSFDEASIADALLGFEFESQFSAVTQKFADYKTVLEANREADDKIGDLHEEIETARKMQAVLVSIESLNQQNQRWYQVPEHRKQLLTYATEANSLAAELPSHLQDRMNDFASDVRVRYRTWIVLAWTATPAALLLLLLMMRLFYTWIFGPLKSLIDGSRRVAAGDFNFRIHAKSRDEMAELASAMNNMTKRFQEIRDDLNGQVRQRTKEVVRSEQLASVGFLAAGVAHEINNPLASIALCAESLEERIHDIIASARYDSSRERDSQADAASSSDADAPTSSTDLWSESAQNNAEIQELREYLRMIQDEAFRCKQITERLLDFSRLSDVEKQSTELTAMVQDVVQMIKHVGTYKEKNIVFEPSEFIYADVNAQEMKQVVLNLITNGLDSLNPGGTVSIKILKRHRHAHLVFSDNGCGMTDEVKEHIFEPFFTRRRDGQGTGLGTSISYRIVIDHGGSIDVASDGPGRGSRFTVKLPLIQHEKNEHDQRSHAA